MATRIEKLEDLARVFQSPGDKTKLSIMALLTEGEMNVATVRKKLNFPTQTDHISPLMNNGPVRDSEYDVAEHPKPPPRWRRQLRRPHCSNGRLAFHEARLSLAHSGYLARANRRVDGGELGVHPSAQNTDGRNRGRYDESGNDCIFNRFQTLFILDKSFYNVR